MEYSKYNLFVEDNDRTLIFNTLSGAFITVLNKDLALFGKGKNKALEKIFFDNGILIKDSKSQLLKYKYKCYKQMFDNSHLSLSIAPTMHCNLSCNYCFEGGNKSAEYMTEEVIDATVEKINVQAKKKDIYILWFGGEPLLGLEQITSISEKLAKKNIIYTASIITNGTLLTKDNREKLKKIKCNWHYIQITFDGIGESHDKKRFFKGKKGSFHTIMDNLDGLLKETDITIVAHVNVDKENITAYEDAFRLFYSLYPDYIKNKRLQIQYNHIQNRTNFKGCGNCYEEEERMNLIRQYSNLTDGARIPPRLPGKSYPCMFRSHDSYAIGPDGGIYTCLEFLGDKTKSIGNIVGKSVSFQKVAETTFASDPFEDEECLDCYVFPICGGGCPTDRIKNSSNKESKERFVCSYYKKHLPEIIKMVYKEEKNE